MKIFSLFPIPINNQVMNSWYNIIESENKMLEPVFFGTWKPAVNLRIQQSLWCFKF